MAQALKKVNNVSKAKKNVFFVQKKLHFSEIPFLAKFKSLDQKKKPTIYLPTTSSYATNPKNILFLLKAPERSAERAWSGDNGKKTEILKNGTHGDRGSSEQNESLILDVTNALYFVSLVRVVVILMIKIFIRIFESLQ